VLILSSDESQSKAQFNLQSLEENKTGYLAENRVFSTEENFKKSPHLFCIAFYTLLIMYCYVKQCYSSLPISYNFHVMLLLVNVMFASNLINLTSKPNSC